MTVTGRDRELELLADVAGSFAAPDPERTRAVRDGGGRIDRKMWRRMAEAGWFSIMVPEERGGAGLGLDAATIVSES